MLWIYISPSLNVEISGNALDNHFKPHFFGLQVLLTAEHYICLTGATPNHYHYLYYPAMLKDVACISLMKRFLRLPHLFEQ